MRRKPRRRAAKHHVLEAPNLTTSSPVIGAPTLTVSDLAAVLAPIAPDVAGTVQRIRHWTREDALRPAAYEHAGPGKHRRYNTDAVYSAAALHVMTYAGIPISHSRVMDDATQIVSSAAAKWHARGKAETLALPMVIGMTAKGATQVAEGKLKDERGFRVTDVVLKIEIDLAKLFAEVDRGH
jgi:DNA-binding transcriptional MerR regulator